MSVKSKKSKSASLEQAVAITVLFEAHNCNPNGDPDANNEPRQNQWGHGYITQVAQKSWIRKAAANLAGSDDGILMRRPNTLADDNAIIWDDLGIKPCGAKNRLSPEELSKVQEEFCRRYLDVRMFGQLLDANRSKTERFTSGQIVGPVQMTYAESIDPIQITSATITRSKKTNDERTKGNVSEMGSQHVVDYALYRSDIMVSPVNAQYTGMNADDVKTLLNCIMNIVSTNFTSTKVGMRIRGLHVWVFDDPAWLHNPHIAFDTLNVEPLNDTNEGKIKYPRNFNSYKDRISLNTKAIKTYGLQHYELETPAQIEKIELE